MSGRGNPAIGIFVGIIILILVKLSVEVVPSALVNVILCYTGLVERELMVSGGGLLQQRKLSVDE
mgnify:CR=1 FL=1